MMMMMMMMITMTTTMTVTMILNFYGPVYMALVQIEVGISYLPLILLRITPKVSNNGIEIIVLFREQ